MKQWLKWILGVSVLGLGIWYFLVKDYQYQVSFTSDQPMGVLFHHILDWENYERSDAEISVISKKNYTEILQRVQSADSSFLYTWEIQKSSDDKTRVTAYIKDEKNEFAQKLMVPFGKNDFIKRSVENVKTVVEAQKLKADAYKFHSIIDSVVQPTYCVFLPLKSSVRQKATTMLEGISSIMEYIKGNDIPLNGDPFLEITEWNEDDETINFNFCFPIKRLDSMPYHPTLEFKATEALKGIKGEFNGNYRISDNAWYYLIEYAEKNKIEVEKFPFEIYLNDPHTGGDPRKWKAHIFLPLKK
ncbi:MAG: GyrI-like domain-containing protein [Bacteroidia bacterium]|nr:GyrI-like domain-containing protein [Bacteroidia bacterium]NNF32204.1 hypothetical protein [Flavobacteriaceae bacterium]MBT8276667.1 GyrI-like domain-containing protein [Bacteroidia bacterium]NNJ82110.1 hypothetical protein [Flavobacteriaceae bacterium]NNK55125.1 hypothetical protein [Flavobacteriaceae bacterium]